MPKIKITVLKRFTAKDIFGDRLSLLPENDSIGPCNQIHEGVEYFSENSELPVGINPDDPATPLPFCQWAYHDIYRDMNFMLLGSDFSPAFPRVKFKTCTDGLKPVCFKLECID